MYNKTTEDQGYYYITTLLYIYIYFYIQLLNNV